MSYPPLGKTLWNKSLAFIPCYIPKCDLKSSQEHTMPPKSTRVYQTEPDAQAQKDFQPVRTLATLLDHLDATALPEAQFVSLRSAVLSTARLLGAEPAALAAELRPLLAKLAKIHPGQAGITRKR